MKKVMTNPEGCIIIKNKKCHRIHGLTYDTAWGMTKIARCTSKRRKKWKRC